MEGKKVPALTLEKGTMVSWPIYRYFGGYGFFGFYGHYFDLKNLERVKIYASEWRNFVEITDIYENRIYVSCTQGEELVNDLRELISHARERRAQELQSQETTETR